MGTLIPAFDFQRCVIEPWVSDPWGTGWIIAMGFFVLAAGGLVGNYLLLRRMALIGDAISHSILPGLIGAFLIFRNSGTLVAVIGAFAAGVVTVAMIEFIHRQTRVKPDAAICITFTSLFALGVLMISALESQGSFHIDADCVLYGEIAFVPLEEPLQIAGVTLGPPSAIRMAGILALVIAVICIFYKELLVTAFDSGLARSMGMKSGVWHYGLMAAVILVVVGAFESVGAILAVATLIVPPMFAAQLSSRLSVRLVLTVLHAAISSLLGLHLSYWLNCSVAGAMVVVGSALFVAAWAITSLVGAWQQRRSSPEPAENSPETCNRPPAFL
jgi:manganese/zinc/iron transport system permease protein